MNKTVNVIGLVLLLVSAGSVADGDGSSSGSGRIEVSVSDFVTKDNNAIGGRGVFEGSVLEASEAIAGSIVVESNCDCDIDIDVVGMDSQNNTAIGNAVAGSVVVRAGVSR